MTSRWLFLVAVGLLAIGSAYAGSIKQFEDDDFDDDTMVKDLFQNDDAQIQAKLKEYVEEAKAEVAKKEEEIAQKYAKAGRVPYSLHYGGKMSPAVKKGHMERKTTEEAVRKLAKHLGYTTKEEIGSLHGLVLSDANEGNCVEPKPRKCNANCPFRTIDGTCNNLENTHWGAADTPHIRLLEPDYGDDIGSPRLAKDDTELPNARKVSLNAFVDDDQPSPALTHLSMIWGQFLDHDITLGAHPDVECDGDCVEEGTDCLGIPVPQNDNVFRSRGVECIRVTRDAAAPKCKVREQVNVLTAFIDASMVYGADSVTAARERDLDSDLGLMKTTNNPNGYNFLPLLPQVDDPNCAPDAGNDDDLCFSSGDVRVNENPGLMSMQTLWVREHNRIARRLKDLKPCLKGEQIYQLARKIVGAEVQHITFNEYLPHILDKDTLEQNNLVLKNSGFFEGYDKEQCPSVSNSFAGAAYRFGHSMVQNIFKRFGTNDREFEDIETKNFGNPSPMYDVCNGGVDAIFRGLFGFEAQSVDCFISKAVQENLVRESGDLSDLMAINIQRGRERGIPGYNSFRKLCNLKTFSTFNGFQKVLPDKTIEALKKLYAHPDDVDLWVGGISEIPEGDNVIGPTFSCIIAKQFKALRTGDRFWYETSDSVTGFTREQLHEIRKVTLAGVICNNSDSIRNIKRKVLDVDSSAACCAELEQIDLRKFTDNVDCGCGCGGGADDGAGGACGSCGGAGYDGGYAGAGYEA